MRHRLTSLWLLGPGTVLLALMLGSCAKVDYEEETVTQIFEDPTVVEVDCGDLEVTLEAAPDSGSGTGSVAADVSGGTPPYNYEWLDSMNAVVGLGATLFNATVGNYTVEVTDSLGCSTSASTAVVLQDITLEGEVVIMFITSNSPEPLEMTMLCDPPMLNVPSTLTVQPGASEIPFAFPENTTQVTIDYSWTCGNMLIQGPFITVSGEGGNPVGGAFVPIIIGC